MIADVLKFMDPRVSWVMTLLGIISIVSIALIVERFIYYGRRRVDANAFFEKVREALSTGGVAEALAFVKNHDNPIASILRVGLENYELSEDLLAETIESAILEERTKLERFLAGMNTIGTVSPLLGLLGTVIGLIKAFLNIAVSGSGGPAVVAKGIGEALYTTMLGLIIAVPVIYFYNYFAKKATDYTDTMEATMRKFLKLVAATKAG